MNALHKWEFVSKNVVPLDCLQLFVDEILVCEFDLLLITINDNQIAQNSRIIKSVSTFLGFREADIF